MIHVQLGAKISLHTRFQAWARASGSNHNPTSVSYRTLAHMTCVFSGIEILELQAAATALHGLVLKKEVDVRPKIFPL